MESKGAEWPAVGPSLHAGLTGTLSKVVGGKSRAVDREQTAQAALARPALAARCRCRRKVTWNCKVRGQAA